MKITFGTIGKVPVYLELKKEKVGGGYRAWKLSE
jgi:hypothetical protein